VGPIEYTENGRWGGRLTKTPLPEYDDSIDALAPSARQRLADIWLRRAAMERRVADSFAVIAGALGRRLADSGIVALASRAIDDEYRHAELSRVVASRFAGVNLAAPARLALDVPKHKGASAELRGTLFVVGQCVLNETTAAAFLEVCLARARGPLAKTALRDLLSDEIDHARIGWAHLAALEPRTRAEVARWLLPMAYLNLRVWREETPVDPAYEEAFSDHGAPPAASVHDAFIDALRTLIVPGLARLGMRTGPLEAWLEAGAFTHRPPTEFLWVKT
jgi:hypothetical protein